ncbi:MAG: GGDEF domain-containing protein [Lachnospiraceae bacterium]|nr:GGDEF domain-containing protein [Lachnospiraceae bacterium]
MYDTFLQELIQINMIPVCILLFLVIFLRFNDPYEHNISKLFYPILVLLLVLVIDDNLDYYAFNTFDTSLFHVCTAVIGYNVRIFIMLLLIRVMLRGNRITKNSRRLLIQILLCAPAFACVLITCLAFFTKLVFWYDESGAIMRGPLAYTPHVICVYYALLIFAYAVYLWKVYGRKNEAIIAGLTTILALLGTFVEMRFALRGILIGVIAMTVTFYYLCIHIEYFKYDILTGVWNRTSFYADLQRTASRTWGTLILIDLNDLKLINDENGHAAGDKALKTLVEVIEAHLRVGCMLYRIGGDEFAVLCYRTEERDAAAMMRDIAEHMKETAYSFAEGHAGWESGADFKKVIAMADSYMYLNKQKIKSNENTNA